QVAVTPAVQALAAFPGETQPLTLGRAFGDARLEAALHAVREAALVVVGHGEVERDLGAAVRVLQADVRGDLVILSRHAHAPPARPPAERGKQVAEIEVLEREFPVAELLAPVRGRAEILPGAVASQLVVRGALLRILQRLV